MSQVIVSESDCSNYLSAFLSERRVDKFLLVYGGSAVRFSFLDDIEAMNTPFVVFDSFTANPVYEEIEKGVELFREERCRAIVAVGGGSAIDVAKCIKLYSQIEVPLIAVPTTAGTGSESTCFAVMYRNGEKQSVEDERILPDVVLFVPSSLDTLPLYHKKCTLLDALCQGIESWWSINSTTESREYSTLAVSGIVSGMDAYIDGDTSVNMNIMLAANYSGRAINIAKTTAAHAMSYKLTSLYKIPHGHAVAICLPKVWRYMLAYSSKCNDPRGCNYLMDVFLQISKTLGKTTPEDAILWFEAMLEKYDIISPVVEDADDIKVLKSSVNSLRLKNNPVTIDETACESIYRDVLRFGNK